MTSILPNEIISKIIFYNQEYNARKYWIQIQKQKRFNKTPRLCIKGNLNRKWFGHKISDWGAIYIKKCSLCSVPIEWCSYYYLCDVEEWVVYSIDSSEIYNDLCSKCPYD